MTSTNDRDHPGCPNATLVKDKSDLALQYHNRSVAEQNSLDLSWNLLKSEKYAALRTCICTNRDEMRRFRQVSNGQLKGGNPKRRRIFTHSLVHYNVLARCQFHYRH